MNLLFWKRKPKHKHDFRRLFGSDGKYAVYGCDDCGKCFLLDPTGMFDDTMNLPDWKVKYPKEND